MTDGLHHWRGTESARINALLTDLIGRITEKAVAEYANPEIAVGVWAHGMWSGFDMALDILRDERDKYQPS